MNEEIIFVGSVLAGCLVTIAVDRFVKPTFFKGNKGDEASIDSIKTELNSLEFEKNLAVESATKVNDAFKERKIDVYERDKLIRRYTEQIERYDKKIEEYQNMLDIDDILIQRDNLTDIINRRIATIDERLKEVHGRFEVTYKNSDSRIPEVLGRTVPNIVQHEPNQLAYSDSKHSLVQTNRVDHDSSTEVGHIKDLHHRIVLELERLENESKDDTESEDSKKGIQSSVNSIYMQGNSVSIAGNDKDRKAVKKDAIAFVEQLKADHAP